MLNFYHIAKNAFRECLREPIYYVLLLSSLALIGLFPSMSLFVFREQIKLVVDSCMATTLVFGLVVAVLSASHTISREMRDGTVLLLLSKPVRRWVFILAKITGVIAALTVFVTLCDLASIVSLRVAKDQFQLDFAALYLYFGLLFLSTIIGAVRNYWARVSFSESAILGLLIIMPLFLIALYFIPINGEIGKLNFEVIPALILIYFAVWTMGAITVVVSTRLDMVPNLTVCSIIFLLGLMSNYFLGKGAESNIFLKGLYALIPNWQFFWMADALASKTDIPFSYLIWGFVYVVAYVAACAVVAITLFQDKEAAIDMR